MSVMRRRSTLGWAVLAAGFLSGTAVRADDGPTREQVDADYREQRAALERRHLEALAAVAARQEGEAADLTYRDLFRLAIARDLYTPVEPAAERIVADGRGGPDVQVLAHFVNVVAEADRGAFDESLEHLTALLKSREEAGASGPPLDRGTALALGESYFQRLIHAGRYDIARKVCRLAHEHARDPVVTDHFAARAARLDRLGRPAPAIVGTGVDGERVRLEDHRGQVVLITFWATWCPPCAPEMARLGALADRYRDKGFVVLGVNLDAAHEGAGPLPQVLSAVRRFLIARQVTFPNVLNGDGAQDFARAYGVTDIPVNFLVDREGRIIHFELDDSNRERVVAEAVGSGPAG